MIKSFFKYVTIPQIIIECYLCHINFVELFGLSWDGLYYGTTPWLKINVLWSNLQSVAYKLFVLQQLICWHHMIDDGGVAFYKK